MGGTTVNYPQPSAEEKALMQQQTDILQQQYNITSAQYQQQQALLPFFAEQFGYQLQFNDQGQVTGATKIPNPLEDQSKEIQGLLNERTLAAIQGKLPVDPALETALAQQEQTLRERLQKQFGPGYETSSPGINSIEKFRQTAESLRSAARTGQLTLAEQLGLARQQSDASQQAQNYGLFTNIAAEQPSSLIGAFGNVAQGYSTPISWYERQREGQFQADIQNAQNKASMFAGIGQLVGLGFGALFSDRRLKHNLKKIGELVGGIALYTYSYLGDSIKRVGVLADEVERVVPGAVRKGPGGFLLVDYDKLLEALDG